MLGVVVVYTGLAVLAVGVGSLVKPVAVLRIRTRRQGALVAGVGVVLVALGMMLPARERRIEVRRSRLDQFIPAYQFYETHQISIRASTDQVYKAVQEVTADEILFFQALTWIRRLGRRGPEDILNAPGEKSLLDVATRTTFLTLAEEPGVEIVIGTVVIAPAAAVGKPRPSPQEFGALDAPGYARAAMNFRLAAAGPGLVTLTTETRVHATDGSARRRFAAYWRVIYPGSALIRRMWLRAIQRRAESASDVTF